MRRPAFAIFAALPLMALAACGSPEVPGQADIEASEGAGDGGISQDALETNSLISEIGVRARELAGEMPYGDRPEVVGAIDALLAEQGDKLPPELRGLAQADVKALREAVAAKDDAASRAAAQKMIEDLRASAPAGEAQSGVAQ